MRIDYPRAARTSVWRWWPSWRQWLCAAVAGVVVLIGAFFAILALVQVPPPSEVASAQATILYWNDGTTELGRIGEYNRTDIPITDVPVDVQHAVLAAEDRDFYEHGGVSVTGIGRAVWNNLSGGSLQGGSTITQQYAKNAFLTADRTWWRKAQEFFLATKLETQVSKDEILGDYLNTIYFGRGAYGIETAADQYFRVDASELTVAQGAVLAAIIRSPGGYAPEDNLAKLQGRWDYVLDGMVSKGWLDQAARDAMVFPKIRAAKPIAQLSGTNGYLVQAVKAQLESLGYDEGTLALAGLRVVTTFDKNAQAAAVRAVEREAPEAKGLRVGLAAITPGTGEVVAMYGGKNYLNFPLNNATQAIGQAGSTFKPFALAAGFEDGIGLDTVWNGDSGRDIDGYVVNNFGGESYGDITLADATDHSVNSVFVDLENTVGVPAVMDAAVRAGIPADTAGMTDNLTFVLGTASPHALDLADAYATFAARGQHVDPTVIREVDTADGNVDLQITPTGVDAFTPDVADLVNEALQGVVTNGSGEKAQELGRPAAGKTGTTNDSLSAWFVGYTPQLSAAVMLVRDGAGGQPVSLDGLGGLSTVTGGSFPAAIWTSFMEGALEGTDVEDFVAPATPDEPTPDTPTPTPTTESPSPTPTSESPTPTPTTESPSPTPTTGSPTPTPTPTSPGPTSTSASPTPTPTGTPTPTTSGSTSAPAAGPAAVGTG